jgi:hypothetical protein
VVLDASTPVLAEEVEAQAVFVGMIQAQEADSQARPLLAVDDALEYRVLHSLATILACLGNAP